MELWALTYNWFFGGPPWTYRFIFHLIYKDENE